MLAQRPQPAAVSLPPADTVYFDRDWERTKTLEECAYARVAHRDATGQPVGTVRDYYYPSWKKQSEGKMTHESPDRANGLCTGWFENGQLSFRGTFVNGQAQADYRSWREDGRPVTCTFTTRDALPLINATLGCSNCMASSRKVFTVDLPANTVGVVYKLDLRDEGQPPISWSTALSLAATVGTGGTAAPALLASVASSLASRGSGSATKPTKCHWYITASPVAAQQFTDSKGSITIPNGLYRSETNVPQITSPMSVVGGTRRLFVCVNNDNKTADATATLSVTALVQSCN
ncbi:hypothetical protein FNT36_24910 [Hymenobacter setariae]|uniref:Toxin-antitoxin system YwqK family antitoxin n=1 Tax=Hymenobacter setariae TaxID=2594794 RepID=A0A558BJS2_9BACT|nr:hypothetical protein [Hymenobacter setariae]TVT36757.1 hypothetical protein FNT36_24910 [Hymenobacter setariae]